MLSRLKNKSPLGVILRGIYNECIGDVEPFYKGTVNKDQQNEKKEIKQITHITYFLGLHLGLINCYKIKISAEGLLRIVISLGEKMANF